MAAHLTDEPLDAVPIQTVTKATLARWLDEYPMRRAWLDGVFDGTRTPAPTTVAFLVNLLAAGAPAGGA